MGKLIKNQRPRRPAAAVEFMQQHLLSWSAPSTTAIADAKRRQSAKIRQIADVLVSEGFVTLSQQAEVLGLCRSTTWTILTACHKGSGLSAKLITRLLRSSQLPPLVRSKVLEYAVEKVAGHYGGSNAQRRRFAAGLQMLEKAPFAAGPSRRRSGAGNDTPSRSADSDRVATYDRRTSW
jgi:hypothetical protein